MLHLSTLLCLSARVMILGIVLGFLREAVYPTANDDGKRKLSVFSCYSFARDPEVLASLREEREKIDNLLEPFIPNVSDSHINIARSHVTTSYSSMPVWACERHVGEYAFFLKRASQNFAFLHKKESRIRFSRVSMLNDHLVLLAEDESGWLLTFLNSALRKVYVGWYEPDQHDGYVPHVSLYRFGSISPDQRQLITEVIRTYTADFDVSFDFFFSSVGPSISATDNWRVRQGGPTPGDITPD